MGYKSIFKGAEIDARLEKMVNVTYAELKALRDEGKLIAGQMYRMTDYETTCAWKNTQVAGHPFDLVLTALDEKTLDEKCSAIWSERDTDGYFANSNLAAWDVRYCLDNDVKRFDWADQEGKYIYIALDGWELSGRLNGTYTLNGVTYKKWDAMDGGYQCYILTSNENPKVGDEALFCDYQSEDYTEPGIVVSIRQSTGGYGVIYRLTDEVNNSVPYDFKNIMFSRPLTEGKYDTKNGVDTFCYTFNCFDEDTFVMSDKSVSDPLSCFGNTLGERATDNVFLSFRMINGCCNTLGMGCYHNTFGSESYNNTLGSNCVYNTFGDYCGDNILGTNCSSNYIGANSKAVVFGDHCEGNSLGSEGVGFFCRNIKIASGVNNTRLTPTNNTSNEIRNYTISNCSGQEITVARGKNYETFVTVKKNGTMVEYTIDDILNA